AQIFKVAIMQSQIAENTSKQRRIDNGFYFTGKTNWKISDLLQLGRNFTAFFHDRYGRQPQRLPW
ncbi:MAG: hypothetical protein IKE22_12990, partial [Atopobiaceae bacterium]|nr:hypothetical protein [Atopobiaceae bacterium]